MAKVTFTDEINIKAQRQAFPKLSKLKKGEKVRIQLVDPTSIEMAFVHNLEAPVVEDGRGVLNEDGKWRTRYMGSPLSFGDISIIEDKGIDPKNCPISQFHKEHPDWVDAPRRKFAMHIVKYKTRPGTFKVATPFQVDHLVWVFTDKTFLKLREFAETWGDLRKHDLFIECENEKFQQYNIQVAPEAAWITDKQIEAVKAVYDAGVEEYEDLEAAIGTKKEKRWVEADLREIEEAWGVVLGKSSTSSLSSADSIEDIWSPSTPSPEKSEVDESSEDEDSQDFDSLLADLTK